jgi:hypothetical protein
LRSHPEAAAGGLQSSRSYPIPTGRPDPQRETCTSGSASSLFAVLAVILFVGLWRLASEVLGMVSQQP